MLRVSLVQHFAVDRGDTADVLLERLARGFGIPESQLLNLQFEHAGTVSPTNLLQDEIGLQKLQQLLAVVKEPQLNFQLQAQHAGKPRPHPPPRQYCALTHALPQARRF